MAYVFVTKYKQGPFGMLKLLKILLRKTCDFFARAFEENILNVCLLGASFFLDILAGITFNFFMGL